MEPNPKPIKHNRDFLIHLESYLVKRDGVDKLLKISRYAATHPFHHRLKTFESNVGLSRKAFRLDKFIQDIPLVKSQLQPNTHPFNPRPRLLFYRTVCLAGKSGLINSTHERTLQRVSAWAELVGYIGLKVKDMKGILMEELCLVSTIEIMVIRGESVEIEEEKLRKVREKKLRKKMSP